MKCSAFHFLTLARAGSVLRLGGMGLAAVTLLAACSPTANAPATAGSAPAATALVAVARGRIDIEGGLLALATPRDGTVVKVAVHEGDQVRQGQLLALLDTEPATLAVDTAQAEVAQAQAQLKLLAIKQAAAMVPDLVDPPDDARGSASYKRRMAGVWTERALKQLRDAPDGAVHA